MLRTPAFVFLSFFATCFSATAQEATAYKAQTAQAPDISTDVLKLKLAPLSAAEAQVEAEAWIQALRTLNTQISANEVLTLEQEAKGADVSTLNTQLQTLRDSRSRMLQRVNIAIKAMEERGGDTKPLEQYVAASTKTGFSFKFITAWLLSPEGGIRFGLNLVKFLLTLLAFKVISSIASGIVRKAVSRLKGTSDLLRDFMVNVVRRVTFFIGLIVALAQLDIDITPFVAALGAAGFVLGFALQGTLSNFASGLMILIYRPYDIGEVVTAAGTTGKVDAMTLVSTTLRLPDNQTVIIPNNSIWGDVITNVTGQTTRRVDMTFGCSYGDDLQKAQALLEDIAKNHPKVLAEPAPIVKVHALADSSVNFVVRPWANTSDYWDVFWDITRAVKDRFDAEGLSIPFPQRDVHVHQVTS